MEKTTTSFAVFAIVQVLNDYESALIGEVY